MYIIIALTARRGIRFNVGPFETAEAATQWADIVFPPNWPWLLERLITTSEYADSPPK